MKSITKRRLKTRSIGRNTLHKRRHSNRRWGAGQNKSRKKRMIGGAVDKNKEGGGLTGLFNNSGWKCDCTTTSQDFSSKSAPETAPAKHLAGQSIRPHANKSNAAIAAPKSSSRFKRHVAQSDIKDATIEKKYLINDDFELVSAYGALTIIIRTKRGADDLPEHINNEMFITKINNTDIKVDKLTEFYELLEDNRFYDKPVVLTVARGGAGGSGDEHIKVKVILKRYIPRQFDVGGGGKKTTYRRKKHVTQRKLNTKRINVMVGGVVIKKRVTCECSKEIKKKQHNTGVSEGESEGMEM